jgi:hypothetical protein
MKLTLNQIASWVFVNKELLKQYFKNNPEQTQWFLQIGRFVGLTLSFFGGISIMTKPTTVFKNHEFAYQIAGVLIFTGATITLIGVLILTILLLVIKFGN